MPDGLVNPCDFVQMMDQGPVDMGLSVTAGNTLIFDSYTPEDEVNRRNIKKNNVSKLNQMQNRFPTGFCVGVRATSVTAILSAGTVSRYRVVDKRTGDEIEASDKRPDKMKTFNEEKEAKRKRVSGNTTNHPVISPRPVNVMPTMSLPPPAVLQANVMATPPPAAAKAIAPNVTTIPPPPDSLPNGINSTSSFKSTENQPAQINIPDVFPLPRKCTFFSQLFFVAQRIPLPDIMTPESPPLSPRDIESDTSTPFPFKHADHPMDQPPIFGDLPPQPGTSEDIRAVVFMGDVLHLPPEITDDIRTGASILQDLSKSTTKKQNLPVKG